MKWSLPGELTSLQLSLPRGRIVKYFSDKHYGFLKAKNGRHIFFFLPELDLSGPESALRVGLEVGYDVTLVGRKMRVTKLKVY
ncbi:MAG: cold shock domain-containing protein [Acidobacteria bacterium]|nr:cold shock domain-containing protein [Acidobacteriota bacterium]